MRIGLLLIDAGCVLFCRAFSRLSTYWYRNGIGMDVWVYYIVLVLSGARAGAVLVFFGIEKYIKKKCNYCKKERERELPAL